MSPHSLAAAGPGAGWHSPSARFHLHPSIWLHSDPLVRLGSSHASEPEPSEQTPFHHLQPAIPLHLPRDVISAQVFSGDVVTAVHFLALRSYLQPSTALHRPLRLSAGSLQSVGPASSHAPPEPTLHLLGGHSALVNLAQPLLHFPVDSCQPQPLCTQPFL